MYKTAYLHLNGFGPGIKKGCKLNKVKSLGMWVEPKGNGVHLHYTLYKNNKPLNSVTVDLPSQESLTQQAREAFKLEVQKYSYLLRQGGLVLAANNDSNDVGKLIRGRLQDLSVCTTMVSICSLTIWLSKSLCFALSFAWR